MELYLRWRAKYEQAAKMIHRAQERLAVASLDAVDLPKPPKPASRKRTLRSTKMARPISKRRTH
jgi:hypothetical protein